MCSYFICLHNVPKCDVEILNPSINFKEAYLDNQYACTVRISSL